MKCVASHRIGWARWIVKRHADLDGVLLSGQALRPSPEARRGEHELIPLANLLCLLRRRGMRERAIGEKTILEMGLLRQLEGQFHQY
jgi:hypothetical protein